MDFLNGRMYHLALLLMLSFLKFQGSNRQYASGMGSADGRLEKGAVFSHHAVEIKHPQL